MPSKYDPTAPEGTPTETGESDRKRMTLNMSKAEYRTLEKLAARELCSIAQAIKRSAETRWRIHTAMHPALAYDPAELDKLIKLPNPGHLAYIDDITGEITRLEIH